MRHETVLHGTVVLIALGENLAVLDQQESGDALVAEKVVERIVLFLEAIGDVRRIRRRRQRQRRRRSLQRVMRKDFVEMAERPDADMLAKEPGLGRAERIARGFPQQFLVGRGLGGKWMDEQHQQWRKNHQPPHAHLPLRPHLRAASGTTVTTGIVGVSSASRRSWPAAPDPAPPARRQARCVPANAYRSGRRRASAATSCRTCRRCRATARCAPERRTPFRRLRSSPPR